VRRSRLTKYLDALGIEWTREGKELVAKCPAHADTSPSWHMRDDPTHASHTLHHCWSCKFGGDLVALVMHMRVSSARAAKIWIASIDKSQPVAPPDIESGPRIRFDRTRTMGRRFTLPRGLVVEDLALWPTPARGYIATRSITAAQVARWGMGYSVEGRLEGRIVFVLRNRAGHPVSYMGRTFSDEGKRYLYPRTDEGADLDVMFGEEHWPAPSRRTRIVVTEGAANGLAVERASSDVIGALGGSILRPMFVAKLATFREVIVMTDADSAGDKVASEIEMALARHTRTIRARLPDKVDANDADVELLRTTLRVHQGAA
jgi:DNA primase